eukprot:5036386-Alexandrium_andersonii.AAC.1
MNQEPGDCAPVLAQMQAGNWYDVASTLGELSPTYSLASHWDSDPHATRIDVVLANRAGLAL